MSQAGQVVARWTTSLLPSWMGAFAILGVAGVCLGSVFPSGFGQSPLLAGVARVLSNLRCTWESCLDVTVEAEGSSLGWGAPHLPSWTYFPLPWPGSLHPPTGLGLGFVATGEAGVLRPAGLVESSCTNTGAGRGGPHPASEGEPPSRPPFLLSFLVCAMRGPLSISHLKTSQHLHPLGC